MLLEVIRDYLSQRSEQEVDLLKLRLRDILEGEGTGGDASPSTGRTWLTAATGMCAVARRWRRTGWCGG